MKEALILGASSGVGRALAEELAKNGFNLFLCSRNRIDLEANAANIHIRYGKKAMVLPIDINENSGRKYLIDFIQNRKNLIHVFITIGEISEYDNGLQDQINLDQIIQTNFISITYFISALIQTWDKAEKLNILIISSVAVARPRGNNLVYATSKSALDFYSRGLQHLLENTTIKIVIFRLGYIDTRMSFGKKLMFPSVSTAYTAKKILSKIDEKKRIHYIPGYWRYITYLVRLIPWVIYKKISF